MGASFTRWREVHRRLRRDQAAHGSPTPTALICTWCFVPTSAECWCLHDTTVAMAIEVRFDAAAASTVLQTMVAELQAGSTRCQITRPTPRSSTVNW